jgi:hypothetical protein
LDPSFNIYDVPLSTTIIEGVIFLVVFIADGLLGFLAGREILNPHLHDFLRAKKQVEAMARLATVKKNNVEKAVVQMNQVLHNREVLIFSVRTLNNTYFTEFVPSRMMALERRMRNREILFGTADRLFERISYDPATAQPLSLSQGKLFD